MNYEGSDGKKHRPVMIHRAIFGSFERFLGILTEHTGGNFPVWLSPTQVAVLPLTDAQNDYAKKVYEELENAGFRVYFDDRSEKIGYKIREAENKKVPFMLIIGEKEKQNGKVSLRIHGKGDKGVFELNEFVKKVTLLVTEKTFNYDL